MNLWPGSLFARTVLLVGSLIIFSHVIWLQVFQRLARPTPHHIAAHLAGIIQPIREKLSQLSGTQSVEYIRTLNTSEHVRVFTESIEHYRQILAASNEAETITPLVQPLLGSDSRVRVAHIGPHGHTVWWVKFASQNGTYWARVPRSHIDRPLPWSWLGWTGLGVALSVVGAIFILWHVNQPLRALSDAARLVGQGMTPPTLPEMGPSEIKRLSHAFNQMILDLQRMTADRELLLAGVSHDLRTPLARLRLAAEMLSPENVDGSLHAGLVEDIQAMDSIIDQFLAYVHEGQTEVQPTAEDANELIAQVADRFKRLGHSVHVRLQPLPSLLVQPLSVQRLLTNLIDNALKHAGGDVCIETERVDDHVQIRVLDRGPGIAVADIERLKLPFTRVELARGGRSGSGLGLAIVERIARNNHATFSLLPRPGGGLNAQLSLPIRPIVA